MSFHSFFEKHLVALSIVAVAGFAGCGGGNNSNADGGQPPAPDGSGMTIDGGGTTIDGGGMSIDGGGMTIDAGGMTVDAGVGNDGGSGAFACKGQPLPTTAPSTITVSGTVTQQNGSPNGTPVSGASVQGFKISNNQSLGAPVTTKQDGSFKKALSTGGKPLAAYLQSTATGLVDSYLFPAVPLAASVSGLSVFMVSSQTLTLLYGAGLGFGNSPDKTKGTVVVEVVDCSGNPVSGATVIAKPAPAKIVYTSGNLVPSQNATSTGADGVAYLFNAPAGGVRVNARVPGIGPLRAHTVQSFAGAVTFTQVEP